MSKVVKSVTRAVKKVVSGVKNVISKVVKSPIGKVVIAAAAVYFGGAALAGAFQGASAGSGFLGSISSGLQGAMQGISNAWTSLGTAASQAMGGEFANAGKALAGGFQGNSVTMGTNGLVTQPLSLAGQTLPAGPQPSGAITNPVGGDLSALQRIDPLTNKPILDPAKGGFFSSDMAKYGLISGGMQLGGSVIQGIGAQKAQEEQRNYEAEQAQAARDRYNANVGTNWWPGNGSAPAAPGGYSPYAQAAPTGLVAGAMSPKDRYAELMRQQMQTYDPYAMRKA